jgi:hypothetical protein
MSLLLAEGGSLAERERCTQETMAIKEADLLQLINEQLEADPERLRSMTYFPHFSSIPRAFPS